MAKEEDLKRIELKVSVNCCEGCKRKVLKALSVKGVLRTDIHPTLPKLTVISNVDVRILIKKLSKVGKSAEILSDETPKPQAEEKCSEASEKKSEKSSKKGKDKEGSGSEKLDPENEKSLNSSNESKSSGDEDDSRKSNKGEKEPSDSAKTTVPEATKGLHPTIVTTIPQVNCVMNPSMVQNGAPVMASQARVFYPMEPVAVPMPYYAMSVYPAPQPYYVQDHYYYEMPAYRPPPLQSQATAFSDYFNDDNTVGCRIM